MVTPLNDTNRLAMDAKEMDALKSAAKNNSPEALKETAKQFEALFMNMVLKSMREATPQDGLFDNSQTKMYTSMLDQQLSQTMGKRGVGLADMLVRQLSGPGANKISKPTPVLDANSKAFSLPDKALKVSQSEGDIDAVNGLTFRPSVARSAHVRAFEDRLGAQAEEASRASGIPAKFMLGQAALESGWGRREIPAADGTASHNLFGIKAGANWKGKVVDTPTTEYENGVPVTKMQKFRVYDSYADAFTDYAALLSSNPRYEKVMASAQDPAAFARGLQNAGYATDPHYAAKLTQIITQSLSG